jgi:hypothetical protein
MNRISWLALASALAAAAGVVIALVTKDTAAVAITVAVGSVTLGILSLRESPVTVRAARKRS